jgi:hypothetical protein
VSEVPEVIPTLYAFSTSSSLVSVNGFFEAFSAFLPASLSYSLTATCANSFLVILDFKFSLLNIGGINPLSLAVFNSSIAQVEASAQITFSTGSAFSSSFLLFTSSLLHPTSDFLHLTSYIFPQTSIVEIR